MYVNHLNFSIFNDKIKVNVRRERFMKIHKIRSVLYKTAKLLGDVQAVSSGSPKKVAKRAGRRVAGKGTGKMLRKLFK